MWISIHFSLGTSYHNKNISNTHLEILFGIYSSTVEYVVIHEHLGLLLVHGVYRGDVALDDGKGACTDSIGEFVVELRERKRVLVCVSVW